ncbi:MAG: metallophosphoesterase [Thermoanaerobaculia bacterium]
MILLSPPFAAAGGVAVWEWQDVPSVIAIGDLHGSYDKLIQLIGGAGLIDEDRRWTGGEAHLVVAGDFLDRGPGDRPIMDLLRQLQQQSEAAGGRVHVLLGNHEVMNLVRDTRYVHQDSYRDFVGDETKRDRQNAWKKFFSISVGSRNLGELRTSFNRQFLPGYFGRLKLFERDGEYGAWLLGLPAIVKINDVAYVHGGLKEEFAGFGVGGINRRVHDQLVRHLEQRELLEEEGVLSPTMRYAELMQAAAKALERRMSPERRAAAEVLIESANSPILGGGGPLWYRGNSWEDERIERLRLVRSLELIGADALVVAHSYTGGNWISTRFEGLLFRLDHGISQSSRPLALVAERGEILVLDPATNRRSKPVRELPHGLAHANGAATVPAAALEKFLARSKLTEIRELGRGSTRPRLVVLEKNGQTQRGIFKTVEKVGDEVPDRYQHEVAAYLLDRRLGLGMVPVTVLREIDGHRGSLQWWLEGAVDRRAAEAFDLEVYKTETTVEQLALAEIFDALIGNPGREPSDVLYPVSGDRVFLIDHSQAFPVSSELFWGEDEIPRIPPELVEALRSLRRDSLEAELGELLSGRQIDALLERRDKILARIPR